jgi:hypothetical protein
MPVRAWTWRVPRGQAGPRIPSLIASCRLVGHARFPLGLVLPLGYVLVTSGLVQLSLIQ